MINFIFFGGVVSPKRINKGLIFTLSTSQLYGNRVLAKPTLPVSFVSSRKKKQDLTPGVRGNRCVDPHNLIGFMRLVFTYMQHKNPLNVGKYIPCMDPMGMEGRMISYRTEPDLVCTAPP